MGKDIAIFFNKYWKSLALVFFPAVFVRITYLLDQSPKYYSDSSVFLESTYTDSGRPFLYPLFLDIFGEDPFFIIIVQLLFGLATTFLIWELIRRLTGSIALSTIGGMLYSVNLPALVWEASILADSLATFFATLIILAWVCKWYKTALFTHLMAIMLKPGALPYLALLIFLPRAKYKHAVLILFLPLMMWCSLMYYHHGFFGVSNLGGYNLIGSVIRSGAYKHAGDEFAEFIAAIEKNKPNDPTHYMAPLKYPEYVKEQGKAFYQASIINAPLIFLKHCLYQYYILRSTYGVFDTTPTSIADKLCAKSFQFVGWPVMYHPFNSVTTILASFLLLYLMKNTWPMLMLMWIHLALISIVTFGHEPRVRTHIDPLIITLYICTAYLVLNLPAVRNYTEKFINRYNMQKYFENNSQSES
jgi:hypothetical protein